MANIKSAEKRARQAVKRHAKNRGEKSKVLTIRKRLLAAVQAGDKEKSKAGFKEFCSALDKAVKHGTMVANTVDRLKARAAAKLIKLG